MAKRGKLLLISDLEGCAEYDNNNDVQVKQTTILCEHGTFTAIGKFLKKDPNNKVAFLGDFFDKGPNVVKSINAIVNLYNSNPYKVHIILGNRDVNKLRFIYEFNDNLKTTINTNEIKKYGVENPFWSIQTINAIITQKYTFEKLKLILNTTMGAGPPLYDTTKNIGLQINKVVTQNTNLHNDHYLAYILLRVFNNTTASKIIPGVTDDTDLQGEDKDFITNCRRLFQIAKIVHYDPYFKVLLSHAGGFTKSGSFILSNITYYENIIEKLDEIPISWDNYYIKIFQAQKELMKIPETTETIDQNELMKIPETTETIENGPTLSEVLEFHNRLLTESLIFDDTRLPSSSYILLQAMGLTNLSGGNYYSFIASCALNGACTLDFNVNPDLINKIKGSEIQFVASGHQPHCSTVPLIYQQEEIVFIANDTSNGYRPENLSKSLSKSLELENIPLSYIEITDSNGFECGICAIKNNGEIIKGNEDNNIAALKKDGKEYDYYKPLVKSFNGIIDIPTIEKIKEKFKNPARFTPLQIKPEMKSGGKSRRKSKRKSRKNRRKSHRRRHRCSRC